MSRTTIVIPCYNEALRLRLEEFCIHLLADDSVEFLFVDDGSTDSTCAMLTEFCQDMGERCRLLTLERNQGKAEAVRQGLLAACARQCEFIGFWDADLATPLSDIADFRAILERKSGVDWVFGSRVRLLGRAIDRQPMRHYLGRMWATTVSLMLGLPVYDTQCGAKLFRVSDELRELLQEQFISRWVFDVELIARLLRSRAVAGASVQRAIHEFPLAQWRDVAGSKLRATDFWKASLELARIYRHYLWRMPARQPEAPRPAIFEPHALPPAIEPVERQVAVHALSD